MYDISSILFRLRGYVKHGLLAYNSRGEGIHSPYLFTLVRMITCDENGYYVWSDIERSRGRLLQDSTVLHVQDYGTGKSNNPDRRVCDIAKGSLECAKIAQLFFRWIVFLSRNAKEPLEIVELGTSLGITTAYLALANRRNKVTTFEGSHAIGEYAQSVWQGLGIDNIRLVEGDIDETLSGHLPAQVDFAFIDANHTQSATIRYVQALLPHIHEKTVIFVDDIHHSLDMQQAWETLKQLPQVSSTMDFYRTGALFFDPHYLKRHYRLSI